MPPRTRRAKRPDPVAADAATWESSEPVAPCHPEIPTTNQVEADADGFDLKIQQPRRSKRIAELNQYAKSSEKPAVAVAESSRKAPRKDARPKRSSKEALPKPSSTRATQRAPPRKKAPAIRNQKGKQSLDTTEAVPLIARGRALSTRDLTLELQRTRTSQDEEVARQGERASKQDRTESWARTILPPPELERFQTPELSANNYFPDGTPHNPFGSMGDSSVTSASFHQTIETISTQKQRHMTWQDPKRLFSAVVKRWANPKDPTKDPMAGEVKDLLNIFEDVRLLPIDTQKLRELMTQSVDKVDVAQPDQNLFEDFQLFQDGMNIWKPRYKLFTLTEKDFDEDRKHSLDSNEAVLQRTVMISILDRWRLNRMFTYDCEGQWKLAKNNPLPAAQGTDKKNGGLKADLVIFYRFETLIGRELDGETAIPDALEMYASPDGDTSRCFPFVFIEAKRGEQELQYARYSNMLNASQALWNIYQWMVAGGQEDTFFKHVRVFSITMNANTMIVRIHRAERFKKDVPLKFLFDDLYTLPNYTQNQAGLLVRNLLLEYGITRLRGYLGDAYAAIRNITVTPLRDMALWDLPEVRQAVLRMEESVRQTIHIEETTNVQQMSNAGHAGSGEATLTVNDVAIEPNADSVKDPAAPTKRTGRSNQSGRQKRARQTNTPTNTTESFGASRLGLGDRVNN